MKARYWPVLLIFAFFTTVLVAGYCYWRADDKTNTGRSPIVGQEESGDAQPPDDLPPFSVLSFSDAEIAKTKSDFANAIQRGESMAQWRPRMKRAIDHARLRPTDVIADIGSGTGFLEFTLLENKVRFAKVFAVDIDSDALEIMNFVLETANYSDREKIISVVSTVTDSRLPPDSVDVVFIANTPVFSPEPSQDTTGTANALACLRTIFRAMKSGARLHFVEFGDAKGVSHGLERAGMYTTVGLKPVGKPVRSQEKTEAYFHAIFEKE